MIGIFRSSEQKTGAIRKDRTGVFLGYARFYPLQDLSAFAAIA